MAAMQGMSERHYARHAGVSRGAVQKGRIAGRLVLFADGSIDAAGSDARRAAMTDPAKQRPPPSRARLKPVPEAALSAVGETLREQGLSAPTVGGSHLPAGPHRQHDIRPAPSICPLGSTANGASSFSASNW
ncbi:hypothetical protein [Pseudaminobacter soli (ex Zhang et al. 2022)]|uniref:hypothetical protein n=1 Tax=Pseudaminobacter soli (ex Zhang et al. 2022) TaxID=2831468 RepID=UPI001F1E99D7|nr:hypothetical protein [Pseudaminobacter soli]